MRKIVDITWRDLKPGDVLGEGRIVERVLHHDPDNAFRMTFVDGMCRFVEDHVGCQHPVWSNLKVRVVLDLDHPVRVVRDA